MEVITGTFDLSDSWNAVKQIRSVTLHCASKHALGKSSAACICLMLGNLLRKGDIREKGLVCIILSQEMVKKI
jgi:hypothetical protein